MEFKNEKSERCYKNLDNQITSIHKHSRELSIKSRYRYLEAEKRFCGFLSNEFGVQKIQNVKSKHLERYADELKTSGKSAAYIKTELAGIRYFHDKSGSKNQLCSNEKLNLDRRNFRQDRRWRQSEEEKYKALCLEKGQTKAYSAAVVCRNTGLRLHEFFKLEKGQVSKMLTSKDSVMEIKGKGGKVREIKVESEEVRKLLSDRLQEMKDTGSKEQKLYVNELEGEKSHLEQKKVQNFLNRNREKFQENGIENRECDISYHSFRHNFARDLYNKLMEEKGYCEGQEMDTETKEEILQEVSRSLGHERSDVTLIYLS